VQFGVFLANVELFDSEAFGLARGEAVTMDPQQRLLLSTAAEALPGGPGAASGRAVGAFVGIAGESLGVWWLFWAAMEHCCYLAWGVSNVIHTSILRSA
jgi:hypothetical protein